MRNGSRVRVRVRVRFRVMARAWVRVRLRVVFCSNIAQILTILFIAQMQNGYGGKTRGYGQWLGLGLWLGLALGSML